MAERFKRIKLIYIVLATLLAVGILPLALAGWQLSNRSANELRGVESRLQKEIVENKAQQIALYGQRYRETVTALARAFELSGGVRALDEQRTARGATTNGEADALQRSVDEDPNLIALSILPVVGAPHVGYKKDLITRPEIDELSGQVLARMSESGLVFDRPRVIRSSSEMCMTIASPVMNRVGGEQVAAAVVATISMQAVFRSVEANNTALGEKELLARGLPILFVVDAEGHAVAHPDAGVALSKRSMSDLKVVQDWLEQRAQLQSALAPFTLTRDGREMQMLGAYATAEFDDNALLGVIAMQDEQSAIASANDMRRQTIYISLIAALFVLVIGFFFANQLTRPVRDLAQAAQSIAAGDFSQRIQVRDRTEIGELGTSFNMMSEQIETYIEDLRKAAEENRQLFLGTVKALAAAIDGKDPYTRGHSERVARFSVTIAEHMNLSEDEVDKLRISALLHDVGKIGIDDNILKKPGHLTPEEFEIMKQHPQIGYKIISMIPATKAFLSGILSHHEALNGTGYPQGLQGDQISLQARIIAVADTFDAITTDRPYQKGRDTESALEIINNLAGAKYDGRAVTALVAACASGQIKPNSTKHTSTLKEPSVAFIPPAAISDVAVTHNASRA